MIPFHHPAVGIAGLEPAISRPQTEWIIQIFLYADVTVPRLLLMSWYHDIVSHPAKSLSVQSRLIINSN